MKRCRIVLLSCFLAVAGSMAAEEIDRLLVAVNGKVILAGDLKLARSLDALVLMGRLPANSTREFELNRLIRHELIRQEMVYFPQADQASLQAEIQAKMNILRNAYAEIGGLPALLRQLGLQEDELTSYVRLITITDRFAEMRFGPFVSISDAEVEDYYGNRLLPERKRSNLPVLSLEAAGLEIRANLRQEKISAAMEQWIENIRNHSRIERFSVDLSATEGKRP